MSVDKLSDEELDCKLKQAAQNETSSVSDLSDEELDRKLQETEGNQVSTLESGTFTHRL